MNSQEMKMAEDFATEDATYLFSRLRTSIKYCMAPAIYHDLYYFHKAGERSIWQTGI